ncbi:MAG: ATP-binding protein [Desulfobacterales bacterium]|nr:ATP-binding protein [Desulfobacterales bacterium]
MKELIVISGKGGTGKTSLVAAFASLAQGTILCDADVDAADLHLIMNPTIQEAHDFQSGHTAVIDQDRCTQCGICIEMCRWNAISDDFIIDAIECEGCGVCVHFCPKQAIGFPVNTSGQWFISETRYGPMVHARIGIAEENSGKLVTLVRQQARQKAEIRGLGMILTDGPPGVGCPVIASIGGATAVLIVTEPTVSGQHDMQRVHQLALHFRVPAMICINKADLNPEKSMEIEQYAAFQNLTFLGRIPFDVNMTQSMVQGKTIFEYQTVSEATASVQHIWQQVCYKIGI